MADVIRKALQTIILYRDGSQKMVTPGEIVTLTEKEHNELRQINPDCLGKLDEAELALLEKTEFRSVIIFTRTRMGADRIAHGIRVLRRQTRQLDNAVMCARRMDSEGRNPA